MVLLEKCLHFVDNEELHDSYNKATKIQPTLEQLVEPFKLLCELEHDISIDESLLLWKGCLSWKQYIPKKRSRFGLKAFVLQDLLDMLGTIFCTQVVILCSMETDSDYHATKEVLTLMEDLLHEGHCVYINNWYTSIEVCNVLKNNTIDVIGTLR